MKPLHHLAHSSLIQVVWRVKKTGAASATGEGVSSMGIHHAALEDDELKRESLGAPVALDMSI